MIGLAWKRIINRKWNSLITIFALLGIFIIVPLGTHFAQESKITVEEAIEQYARGSYDILVRPSTARTEIENMLGVVEENYIGDGLGGISIQEWDEIKRDPDIEVAAPVASLGYFSGNRTSINLPYLDHPARMTFQYFTTDGVNTFPIDKEHSFTYFEGKEMEYEQYLDLEDKVIGALSIRLPQNYYLLTAIDVESENELTGLNFNALLEQDIDEEQLNIFLEYRGNPPVIPVLQREDLHIPLSLSVKVEELDISLQYYLDRYDLGDHILNIFTKEYDKIEDLHNELMRLQAISATEYVVDLSKYQSPYNGTTIDLTKDFKPQIAEYGGTLSNDSSLYYVASKIDYKFVGDDKIEVHKVREVSPPLYKEVTEKGQSYLEEFSAPFMLWQVGTFSPSEQSNLLVSSPLGIYSSEEVKTLDNVSLTPTLMPGGFIATPAAGVTTIEAAEIIKGETPIDAIRIRVAGIDTYNKIAQHKIESVATRLLEQGYEVDIVAGSSFRKLEMNVEGIGVVIAPWTTLGVAQTLTQNWNLSTFISTILFAMFGVAWFWFRQILERMILSRENEILTTLGWRKSKVMMRNCMEQYILITTAFIISICIFLLLNMNIKLIWVLIGLWLLSLLVVTFVFSITKKIKSREQSYPIWSSIIHYRDLIVPTMLLLFIAVVLIFVQAVSLYSTYIQSIETSLGEFTFAITFYLQFFILIATLFLVLISISESINTIIDARKIEFSMYFTIGWTKKMILKHFGREVAIWAGISIFCANIIAVIILLSLNLTFKSILVGLFGTFMITIIPIIYIVRRKTYQLAVES
ncbi:MAG: hypothetical protein ACK4M9_16730 [Anaerobacillus sp.]|uniref:hypothetical protein n=1 Tax=Anaerobacillus sp. TaxID=1872506 RepID=UPI0039192790